MPYLEVASIFTTPKRQSQFNTPPQQGATSSIRNAMSSIKKRPGHQGDFGRETPPPTGTTANIHMWFAAWHMDHGHSVEETNQLVDTLRKLKWTATGVRELKVDKIIEDLCACGYEHEWAPRLAGDIQRAIALKVSSSLRQDLTPRNIL